MVGLEHAFFFRELIWIYESVIIQQTSDSGYTLLAGRIPSLI